MPASCSTNTCRRWPTVFVHVCRHGPRPSPRRRSKSGRCSASVRVRNPRRAAGAKRELEERGLCIPLDWRLRRGLDVADLSREMVARFKRPFDQQMFESFRYGVQSVLAELKQRRARLITDWNASRPASPSVHRRARTPFDCLRSAPHSSHS